MTKNDQYFKMEEVYIFQQVDGLNVLDVKFNQMKLEVVGSVNNVRRTHTRWFVLI